MGTEITEVMITPLKPNNGLVALASCVLDGKIYLNSIGIYTKLNGGYRLTYPNRKLGQGAINIFHPIRKDVGESIEFAIISKYEMLMQEQQVEISNENNEDENIYTK